MLRKAYRNYFPDNDKTFPNSDKYFLIKTLERGENISLQGESLSIKLEKNQGLKALVFYKNTNEWKLIKAINTDEEINESNCVNTDEYVFDGDHVFLYEKFDFSDAPTEAVLEYFESIFPVEKGKLGTNGNADLKINKGMFNSGYLGKSHIKGQIGNRNTLKINVIPFVDKFGKKFYPDIMIYAHNDNIIQTQAKTDDGPVNIIAKDNNYIMCDNNFNETCVFGENNYVVNPDFSFNNDNIYLMSDYPKLAFRTIITSDGNEGDTFVEVESVDYVLLGHKFMFSSVNAGFVFRVVTKVSGNKIYFDKPVSKDEVPIKNGLCFAEAPQEKEQIEANILKNAKKYSRRIYVDGLDNENVHLRDVYILKNDELILQTVALYYDEPSKLLILDKTLPEDIDLSKNEYKVVFPEFKFVGPFTFKGGDDIPNVYIGQNVIYDGNKYKIQAFSKEDKTLVLSGIAFSELSGKELTTEKVDDDLYKAEKILFTKLEVLEGKKYLDIITIRNTDGIKPGSLIKYKNKSLKIANVEIDQKNGTANIQLEESFEPFVFNNKIIIGSFVGDRTIKIDDISPLFDKFSETKKGN